MILLVATLALLTTYYYWINRRVFRLARKIKGYRGLPIIGSAYKFLHQSKILDVTREFGETIGSPGKFWLGNRLFVYINDAQHIEMILNDPACLDKGDSYDFISDVIGYGLITLKSDYWRFHRKNLNPCFSYNILNSYFPIFNKNLRILTDRLALRVGKGQFSIQNEIKTCSMDFICETTLGLNLQIQTNENLDILHAADKILQVTAARCFKPWIQPKILFWLSQHYKPFIKSVATVTNMVNKLLTSKMNEYYTTRTHLKSAKEENSNGSSMEKNIFIDQLIKLALVNNIFTEHDVASELKTMLLAGFETTATCSATIFALIAIHQDVQEKLFQEIRSVIPIREQDVTRDDIKNMTYLDAFIKESLRMFPTVPFITRIVKREIKVGDVIIPEGTELILDFWCLHRKQQYWKFDATIFNPDNFLAENVLNRHPYAYIPFSAGPRNCIGMRYADIALKLLVIYVLRQYKLTTEIKLEDLKFQMNLTLTLLNEDIFELTEREIY